MKDTEDEKEELGKLDKELIQDANGNGNAGRGRPYVPSDSIANLVFAWSSPPTRKPRSETRMLHDLFANL